MSGDNLDVKVLEARVDWLTATVGPGYKGAILASRAADWQAKRCAEGYRLKEFRWSGYLGESVDGITWGQREDGSILRLSGEMAHRYHQTALTFASNVSRIDVQVTVQTSDGFTNYASLANALVQDDNRVKNGMTRTSLIKSTPRGTTSYIGSRSSDRYMRVYDKTAESDGAYPNYSWRYEVEYKKDRAFRVAQEVLRQKGSPEGIRQIVEQAFANYRIAIPVPALPPGWRDAGIRQETNDERRLAWLQTSIRPMLSKLMEGIDKGTILEALGLDGLIDATTGEHYDATRELMADDRSIDRKNDRVFEEFTRVLEG